MDRIKFIISAKLFLASFVLTSCSMSSLSAWSDALGVANSVFSPSNTPASSTTQFTTSTVPNTNTSISGAQFEVNGISNESTSSKNSGNYEIMYRNWESRVESCYNSLMSASSTASTYTSQKRSFNEAQRKMKGIRAEAARQGVIISPSSWETATVSVAGGDGLYVHKIGTQKKNVSKKGTRKK